MLKRREAVSKTDKTLRYMRCFEEFADAFVNTKQLPLSVCFQRSKIYYKIEEVTAHDTNVYLFDSPIDDSETYFNAMNNFEYLNSDHVIDKNLIEYLVSNSCTRVNNLGKWILITKIKKLESFDDRNKSIILKPPLWLLKYRYGEDEQPIKLVEFTNKDLDWISYVEAKYSLIQEENVDDKFKPNLELMQSISRVQNTPSVNWTIDCDEELAELLKDLVNTDHPGSIRNLIKTISVSTQRTSEDIEYLISLDKRTYWESDSYGSTGYNGFNVIRIFLKPNKKIKQLFIVVNKKFREYLPKEVSLMAGDSPDDITELNKLTIKQNEDGDILLLEKCQKAYDYIEIRLKSGQRNPNGNCRVYGIKIFTYSESDEQLSSEIFVDNKLQSTFPRLSNFKPTYLFRRAELLLRFIKLFDLCMDAMLPSWSYDEYFQNIIKTVKKLLVLSSRRIRLLEEILNSIPTTPCYLPLIHIDRPLAFAYRGKHNLDPKYQNTIFMQIYNSLSKSYSFRWEKNVEQWWECKFIGEGIIDQGGGFRDSLSDIAEELCPNTGCDTNVPLPFFIRSPNQHQSDLNTYRDSFVPNPSCNLFQEYEFIGKLMGACLRSKECMPLYLAPLFWKKISGEKINWKNDFVTVDATEVKLIDSIEKMSKEEYDLKYANEITWSCVLSDGTLHKFEPNGNLKNVSYEERLDYCERVKRIRISESDKQIEAIKRGMLSVLSKHIFYILTWSEFELKICGAPKITVEDLKMSIEYEDELSYFDNRVKFFWEAISNFSNEERSKFLRFVTGRKRLPVKIFFCSSDQPNSSFPDSSTCNCSLYFPNYTSAQIAEEKLRYAIHNCVAIDTDCSSYDD